MDSNLMRWPSSARHSQAGE